MIVDAHIHIHPFPMPENGLKMPPKYEAELRHDLASVGIPPDRQAETTIERMDAAGVDACIVVNPYHLPQTGHVRTNRSVHETIKPFKGRIYALAGINVQPEPDVQELENAVAELGFRGLKLTLSGHIRPNNFEKLDRLYRKLIEFDLPVVWHPGPSRFDAGQSGFAYDIRDYYDAAQRYPDLKIVIAHGGIGTLGGFEVAVRVASACKNVYIETAAVFHQLAPEYMPPDHAAGRRNFTVNYLYPKDGQIAPEHQEPFEQIKAAYSRFIRVACNRAPGKLIYGTDIPFADRWDYSIPLFREAIRDDVTLAEVMGETARAVYKL